MRITRSALGKLELVGGKRRTWWDDEQKGFGVTKHVGGDVSFVVKMRIGERQIMKTLGKWPALTPEDARRAAAKYRAKAAEGIDLAAEIRTENRRGLTMNALFDIYEKGHLLRKRPRSQDEDRRKITRLRGQIGHQRIADVTQDELTTLHDDMRDTPVEANRTLAFLSKAFSIAKRKSFRADNPVSGIEKYQERKRQRFLTSQEGAKLKAVLEEYDESHPDTVDQIRLMGLTGARRGEVLNMTWDQFDLVAKMWTKPGATTKQNTEHCVPLSDRAVAVLIAIRERRPPKRPTDPVFPLSHAGSVTALKRLWPRIRKEAGLEPTFRLHDLRHSFASSIAAGKSSLPIIGALLGHTQPQTTARYAHLVHDVLREALENAR